MESVCREQVQTLQQLGSSKEAFEAVVRKYMKEAYFIALGLVGNRDDALDLSQEAFVRAYSNLHRFDPNRSFFPWFYQILRNLCFSHLRKKRRRTEYKAEQGDAAPPIPPGSLQFDPSMVAQKNEASEQLWDAIGQLDDKHREVIILRHFQHMSYEEISTALACNKGTVTSRLYHARNKLKEILENEKGGPM